MKSAASRLFPRHRPKKFSKLVCFNGTLKDIHRGIIDLLALLKKHGYIIESATRSDHYIVKGQAVDNRLGSLVMVHFKKAPHQRQEMWPCWNLMHKSPPTWNKKIP